MSLGNLFRSLAAWGRASSGRRARAAGWALIAGSALWLSGCLAAPSSRDWLAVGFRSPEQCWRSFQTAVRADEPGLEYRCLSQRLIRERQLSQFVWRELREEFYRPLGTRWAIANATPSGPARIAGEQAELTVKALGKRVRLRFVREDYRCLWSGEQPLVDEAAPFSASSGVQNASGQRWFYASVPLPEGAEAAAVSELQIGREWKLDGLFEEPAP